MGKTQLWGEHLVVEEAGSAGVDEEIVDKGTADGTQEGRHDGYPEVKARLGEHAKAPAKERGEQARGQVTGRVQGETSLVAKGGSDGNQRKSNDQGLDVAGGGVTLVRGREDDEDEEGGADELGKEGSSVGDALGLGTGDKDADSGVAVGVLDGRIVGDVDNKGTSKSTEELGGPVDGDLGPGEAAEDGLSQGDGGVKVATRHAAGDIDTKGQTKTPSEGHGEPRVVVREDQLSNGARSKGHQDGSAQELGECLAELVADTGPLAVGLVVRVGDADKAAGSATAFGLKKGVGLTGIVLSH